MPEGLGPILAATVTVADLEYASAAYCALLGYEYLAEDLNAGIPWRVLGPAGARWGMLRLEEVPDAVRVETFRTLGWSAIEVLVADVDVALSRCLEVAGFEVIQPPVSVGGGSSLRALQMSGPGGEGIYLTQVDSPPELFTLPSLDSGEHHVFVVVVGTHDLPATRGFFERGFGTPAITDHPLPVKVLNRAYSLPSDSLHRISTMQLALGTLIEVDEYPPAATVRPPRSTGISSVTFAGTNPKVGSPRQMPPQPDAPYWGMAVWECNGPFGLRIEIVDREVRSI